MAFGFLPKYTQEFELKSLNTEQFLIIACDTALELNWDISYISKTELVAYTKFSMSSWSEKITIRIDEGVAEIKSECTGNQIIDWGKNEKNITTFLSIFNTQKKSITSEEIEGNFDELKEKFSEENPDSLSSPPVTTDGKITDFFALFKPTEGYFLTPILLNLNILVFAAMVLTGTNMLFPDGQSLLLWGGQTIAD